MAFRVSLKLFRIWRWYLSSWTRPLLRPLAKVTVSDLIPLVRVLLFSASTIKWTWLLCNEKWIILRPWDQALRIALFKSFRHALFLIWVLNLKLICIGVRGLISSLILWATPLEWSLLLPDPSLCPPCFPLLRFKDNCFPISTYWKGHI